MRLLFVTNLYPPVSLGGYEQICFDVASGLQARGHEVSVLTSMFRASEAPSEQRGVYRRLKLLKGWGSQTPGQEKWVGRNRVAVEVHNSRVTRRAINRLQTDIVMFWNGSNMGRGLLSTAEKQARVVYYLSDPWLAPLLARQAHGWDAGVGRRLYHMLLTMLGVPSQPISTEHLLFCSNSLRAEYAALGAGVSNGTIIYHGISPEAFPLASRAPFEAGGEVRLLYAGRVSPEKGIGTLVEAMHHLGSLQPHPKATLRIVGPARDDAYEQELKQQIGRLGLDGVVRMDGPVPRHELKDLYAAHDIFVFPSEWAEPFSVTLLEAMSTGLPVLASLRGGTAEIVRDGENAVAFKAGDAQDLAAKLHWMASHPQEVAQLGVTAAEEVRERFTLTREVSAIENYLAGVKAGTDSGR
ncbi:MAG TPA: glycosyltransferase family 4 protein [Chloroflexia bacterium]|jgi:glycosyltransferase involved in cell wall biosynthesis